MSEPKALTDDQSRQTARWVRDRQWRTLERIAEHNPLYICWWDKHRRHKVDRPDDLEAHGLIDGMELAHWLRAHPEWTTAEEWSDERCAQAFYITDVGRDALANRQQYDMEPVVGGLVEPGWQAVPTERK